MIPHKLTVATTVHGGHGAFLKNPLHTDVERFGVNLQLHLQSVQFVILICSYNFQFYIVLNWFVVSNFHFAASK